MARLMLILALALIVFGPQDLLRLARILGRAGEELRWALGKLTESITTELEVLEREEASHSLDA